MKHIVSVVAGTFTVVAAVAALVIGAAYAGGSLPLLNGDVDCSGSITPVDSLKILRHDAGLSNGQAPGCAPIGDPGSGNPPTSTPSPTPVVGLSRDNPVPAGQAFMVPEGWEITILDFTPNGTQEVLDENQFNDPPEPGMQFSIVRVRTKNVSAGNPADNDVFFAFRMVGSEDIGYPTLDCGVIPDSFLFKPDDIFEGGSLDGNLCYVTAIGETDFTIFTDYSSSGDANIRWLEVE